ncbi:hypothetical protein [Kitasatospora sp. NPDC091207]|uniref:hypothetical protein n=1 Tax=Kitasatospora sp. NPDC091207 TaxID=3364083 RepID=UPI0037FCA24F
MRNKKAGARAVGADAPGRAAGGAAGCRPAEAVDTVGRVAGPGRAAGRRGTPPGRRPAVAEITSVIA